MAIETVYLFNNTSVVHDEILGQRIGLVPLAVDPHMFTMFDGNPNDRNTLVFNLNVKCERNKNAKKDETDPEKLYHHSNGLFVPWFLIQNMLTTTCLTA